MNFIKILLVWTAFFTRSKQNDEKNEKSPGFSKKSLAKKIGLML